MKFKNEKTQRSYDLMKAMSKLSEVVANRFTGKQYVGAYIIISERDFRAIHSAACEYLIARKLYENEQPASSD